MQGIVYVDFDGTIAPSDPTDTLFDRYCDPSWRDIEADWQQGKSTARECMARQVDLVRAVPEVLDQWLGTVEIDPKFPGFVELCRRWGLQVVVLSDGMDRVVGRILTAAGIKLPYFANQLVWQGGDRWKLEFPFARAGCDISLGNCKCNHRPSSAHRGLDIVVGDGRSDFCIAERAQLVLAKGQLAAHCRTKDLPHWPIENFADATLFLSSWVARHARKTA